MCWGFFSIKKNFIKKRLQHRCFAVNIVKFLRKPILKKICERLLNVNHCNQLKGTIRHCTQLWDIKLSCYETSGPTVSKISRPDNFLFFFFFFFFFFLLIEFSNIYPPKWKTFPIKCRGHSAAQIWTVTLSWWRSLLNRNQSIDLFCKERKS